MAPVDGGLQTLTLLNQLMGVADNYTVITDIKAESIPESAFVGKDSRLLVLIVSSIIAVALYTVLTKKKTRKIFSNPFESPNIEDLECLDHLV